MENEDISFKIKVPYKGEIAVMEVNMVDENFVVTYNGKLITEATNDEVWYQVQAPLIDDDLFDLITDAIESHYE